MGHRSAIVAALLALSDVCVNAGPTDSRAKPVDFDREIRPIFSDRCFACHGPDQKPRMANLRLDIKEGGAYSTRGSYQLVVPGDATKSRLYQRIATSLTSRMPPVAAGPALTVTRSEEHTSELQSHSDLVCRLL